MKKTYLLLLLSIFMFSACSSDDDDSNENNKVKLTATFNYLLNDVNKPDVGSTLYLFKGQNSTTIKEYQFDASKNHFIHKTNSTALYPTQTERANDRGVIEIDVEKNTSYVTVFKSLKSPDIWGIDYIDIKEVPVTLTKEYAAKN